MKKDVKTLPTATSTTNNEFLGLISRKENYYNVWTEDELQKLNEIFSSERYLQVRTSFLHALEIILINFNMHPLDVKLCLMSYEKNLQTFTREKIKEDDTSI